MSEAITIKSLLRDYPDKLNMVNINRHTNVNWRKSRRIQLYTTNYRQLRNAENRRNKSFPRKNIPIDYPKPNGQP